MTEKITVAEHLRLAREKIADPENWGKGLQDMRPSNTLCAIEALDVGMLPADNDMIDLARIELCLAIGCGKFPGAITVWNDAPERTHAEVLAAFDRAILQASHAAVAEAFGHGR